MGRRQRPMRLRTATALFVSAVVVVSLLFTGLLIGIKEIDNANQNEGNKAMAVAEVVAKSPIVVEALEGVRNRADVQEFATAVQRTTDVPFIVVMDMNHIRLSHPNPQMIGKHFVGGDEGAAMHGKQYVSVAKGTLGTSLRAFVPVYADNGVQVGVVSVGIMLNHVRAVIFGSLHFVYLGIGLGLAIGIIGAFILAAKVKRMLFGLEPYEIGQLWQERNALLESVREGVLAVNADLVIILANAEAIRMFRTAGIVADPQAKPPGDYMPETWFRRVLETGSADTDMEYHLGGYTFVVNLVPVQLKGETIGVVATFRDKTELKHLAEQLTGVKLYAEALRSQSHEFMNRLHVILALVHGKQYGRLDAYIRQISNRHQEEVGSISGIIQEPVLAGFFLSKLSFARENDVELHISGHGVVPETDEPDVIDDIITITGNLIDNAFEAVANRTTKVIEIDMTYEDEMFYFTISDSGGGVPAHLNAVIYERGFSTKGEGRGYGLFLVHQCVQRLGGELTLKNGVNGAVFVATIPYSSQTEEDADDSRAHR